MFQIFRNSSMQSIAPPTKSPPGSPMSEDSSVPHASPSIASIFPPNYSGSGGSESGQTIPQCSNSISIIFPPTKSQTESSESNQRFGQFSHSIPSIFPPTKSQTDQSSESNERLKPFSQNSIASIFPPNYSGSGGSTSDQTIPQYSNSISVIFPPTKSETESSESNQRFRQFSHSIPSVFPPTKSQTDQSSESNERLTRFSQYSIPSIFRPNKYDDANSLDSMPKDMRNTKENKRIIKSKRESIDVPEFVDLTVPEFEDLTEPEFEDLQSIDVPEFKDLGLGRVVRPFKQTLQGQLQRLIEDDVAHMNWTYGIFWKLSHNYSGVSILNWGFGFYKDDKDNLKAKTTSAVLEQEHVKKMSVNLSLLNSGGSVDEQELTDTEWFFLASKMLSFVNGSDLPGTAFATSNPVWVAGVSLLASSPYDRARQGQHSGLQTMVCVPFELGVVELGSTTELLLEKNYSDRISSIKFYLLGGRVTHFW